MSWLPNRILLRKIVVNLFWVGVYGVFIGGFTLLNLTDSAKEFFVHRKLANKVLESLAKDQDVRNVTEAVFLPR